MKNILIHGLGQNSKDWDTIKNELETRGISSVAPDLFDLAKGRKLDYPTVYQAFSELCESYQDKLTPPSRKPIIKNRNSCIVKILSCIGVLGAAPNELLLFLPDRSKNSLLAKLTQTCRAAPFFLIFIVLCPPCWA